MKKGKKLDSAKVKAALKAKRLTLVSMKRKAVAKPVAGYLFAVSGET